MVTIQKGYTYVESAELQATRRRIAELKAEGGNVEHRLTEARERADVAAAELARAEVAVLTGKAKQSDLDKSREQLDRLSLEVVAIPRQAEAATRAIEVLEGDLRALEVADKTRFREQVRPRIKELVTKMADALVLAAAANDELNRLNYYELQHILPGFLKPWQDMLRTAANGAVIENNSLDRWLTDMRSRALLD